MQEPVAEVGAAHNYKHTNGIGVYYFIRDLLEEGNDLIEEGKDAWFVNDKGRFAINWVRSPGRYADYKSRNKNIDKRKASNNLRSALLNFYEKEGAKEYKESQKKNEKGEIIERQFQIPPRIFKALFGPGMLLTDDDSEQEIGNIASEVCKSSQETSNSSDTGFDEAMDISSDGSLEFQCQTPLSFNLLPPLTAVDITSSLSLHTDFFNISDPDDGFVNGGILTDGSLPDNTKSDEIDLDPPDEFPTPFEILGISEKDLRDEICFKHPDSYNDQAEVVESIFPLAGSVEGGLSFDIILKEELPEEDTSAIYVADFEGLCVVDLAKLDHSTLAGITPPALVPGPVKVTVKTPAGQLPGSTSFLYVDHKTQEVLEQLVKDPALQSLYSRLCDRELSIFGSDSSTALNLGSFAVQGQVVTENETNVETRRCEDEDKESDYFADAETSSCGSFELEAGWSDSEDGEGPCLKDEGPHKELSERSSSSLEERTSFEIPDVFLSEERIHLEHVVEKDDDEDENCEEHASVNPKPDSALDELPKWLSALQIVDATTSRQQGACVTVDEMHEDQLQPDSDNNDGTYPKNGESKKELHGRSTSSIDNISNKIPVAEFDTTTAREEGAVGGGTQKRYDTSIRQQEANACPSHEETAKAKRAERLTFNVDVFEIPTRDWIIKGPVPVRFLSLCWLPVFSGISQKVKGARERSAKRKLQELLEELQRENGAAGRMLQEKLEELQREKAAIVQMLQQLGEMKWRALQEGLLGQEAAFQDLEIHEQFLEMKWRALQNQLLSQEAFQDLIQEQELEELQREKAGAERMLQQEQRLSLQQENQVLKREMKMLNTTGGMEINTFIKRIIMENEKLCTEIKTLLKDETEGSLQDMNDKQTKEVTALLEEIDVHQDGIEEIKVSDDERKAFQDEMEASLKEMNDKQKQTLDSSEEKEEHAENLEELPQL